MLFRAVAGYKIEVDGTLPHVGEHLSILYTEV